MHLPGGPDPFTYAWEVIAVRPDSTILTALVAAVRPKGKKRTKFVDFTDIHLPGFNPVRLMLVANAMRDLNAHRSEEHTSELQSLMRISYAVFCLKKKNNIKRQETINEENNKKTKYK